VYVADVMRCDDLVENSLEIPWQSGIQTIPGEQVYVRYVSRPTLRCWHRQHVLESGHEKMTRREFFSVDGLCLIRKQCLQLLASIDLRSP